ncbi:MAG: hypothetical protein E7280_10710 [Lachnospiraceae bacterium]|nr:hypothetical protein [Lachnospiraceae bacterium]
MTQKNMVFFQESASYLAQLEGKLSQIETELATLPVGTLHITKDRKWTKWRVTHEGKEQTLPKSMADHASLLARKRYLEALHDDLTHEIRSLKNYFRGHRSQFKSDEYLSPDNRFYPLLQQDFELPSNIRQWLDAPYIQNLFHPENKRFRSLSGNMVRSKSEMMIDEMLFRNHIPYHYEEQLVLPHIDPIYPDFKIYSTLHQRFFYWEHFGMMDNTKYLNHDFLRKMDLYSSNQILPGIDLIMTFETKDSPLDYARIEFEIKRFLIS